MLKRGRKKTSAVSHIHPALPFMECPAKTWTQADGTKALGRSVFNHCQIVGEVARALIALYPEWLRYLLFPQGVILVAACHDIGKVSPSFVIKLYVASHLDYKSFQALARFDGLDESFWGGHAGVSQATAETLQAPTYVPQILGLHHGFNPMVDGKEGTEEVFGGQAWFEERKKLVDALKISLNTDWPHFTHFAQARVTAGLTSVADWIGSGRFFEDPSNAWQSEITHALDDAGFIAPKIKPDLTFTDIFDPDHKRMTPRPVQMQFIEQVAGPGVYVLEAQMGVGKTEAALYAAYRVLAQGLATGIYFGLPTQLTSNKIYERFNAFLTQIIDSSTPQQALLLHSSAWLTKTAMGEEGLPGGDWFNQKKRGLLAPFGVGTIDQALMAVMNVKHGFVRAFGLAGKVVILDEVHSYDLYTGTILNELVAFLKQVGCTVIILSATLNQTQRTALLGCTTHHRGYPLISALPTACSQLPQHPPATLSEIAVTTSAHAHVMLHHCQDNQRALEEALARAAEGQQVLWIENTVAQAQQTYLDLASRAVQAGCEIGLLHSRFIPQQREINESRWVQLLGPKGRSERSQQGRILVGTQVLEQSLDIDADFLISRFAPTDMLLQRLGRLWRHHDTPRPASAQCMCWLLLPKLNAALNDPDKAFGATASIYSAYVLCRSLAVWQSWEQIVLPDDIRTLIDQTYQERDETGCWQKLKHIQLHGSARHTGEHALQGQAKLTLVQPKSKTQPESKAETRFSEDNTVDLLLLRTVHTHNDTTKIRLLDGRELDLPHHRYALTPAELRQLAVTLHQQVVRIRAAQSPAKVERATLEKLGFGAVFYLGHSANNETLLRVACVSQTGELQTLDGCACSANALLEYRDVLGFRALSNKE